MAKQQCKKHNGKFGGCSHFYSGMCRLLNEPNNKCVMVSGGQCYICCKFLNSALGLMALDLFEAKRRGHYDD